MTVCCRILFFLNTNIDNVGLCRLSVSIYLTPLGNWFFSFCWQSGLFFAHYPQSVNPIQTLPYVQARMLFFLNKNSDNVRPCRLSVGIYLSLLGNCFFVLLVVRSVFRPLSQVSYFIQTLLQLIRQLRIKVVSKWHRPRHRPLTKLQNAKYKSQMESIGNEKQEMDNVIWLRQMRKTGKRSTSSQG